MIGIKKQRKRMKWKTEKERKRREMREDRPSKIPDGREVRMLEPRSMKEGEMKRIRI